MAGEPQEQLSLMDAPAVQGSLFGPAEALPEALPEAPGEADPGDTALDDAALIAQAAARPRKRQAKSEPDATETNIAGSGTEDAAGSGPDDASDLPCWHHHGLVDPAALTPMLRHYVELKATHPDRVLLYRLGDFFEFFFEDALLLSRLLELTLTGKEAGKRIGRVPMAGIPHHAVERYCAELVRHGLSIALCDQLEAVPAKGSLLKRGITR